VDTGKVADAERDVNDPGCSLLSGQLSGGLDDRHSQ